MKRIRFISSLSIALALVGCEDVVPPTSPDVSPVPQFARGGGQANMGINVLVDGPLSDDVMAELARHGSVMGRIDAIRAVFLVAPRDALSAVRALPFVTAANADAQREAAPPLPPVQASDFAAGLSTWDLDAVDVTDLGAGRTVAQDGSGVYVGVLDTGLLTSWPYYLPSERIVTELARSFGGGGAVGLGNVSIQPNKWAHDVRSHGTHVVSTILGYRVGNAALNGVAPRANVIPVKVLNNNGRGWSSVVSQGIVYLAELKAGALGGAPLVINMSLGGSALDAVEQAAIDYAISLGVIVVAAAGNSGERGMSYPGGYPPVISVGASGWGGEWVSGSSWWLSGDVADPTNADDFYVTDFSGRELPGQDLDVLAPGSWVLGPYQVNIGQISYFFLGGTSQASPHVAGIVALMAQANAGLTAADAESILESTALPLGPGTLSVATPFGTVEDITWGADATGSGLASAPAAIAAAGS